MKVTQAAYCFREPPPYLVPDLVRYNSLHLINADPFTGKTALATAIAVSVATGTPLFENTPPCDQGRVLFIAIDAAPWDYGSLLHKVCFAKGLSISDMESFPLFYCFDQDINIEAKGPMTSLIEHASYHNPEAGYEYPDLIIVDTLLSIHQANESDAIAMKRVMRCFRTWPGVSWLLLHHNAKNPILTGGNVARGSTVIPGAVDMHLILRPRGTRSKDRLNITAEWAKGRGGDLATRFRYTMNWGDNHLSLSQPLASLNAQEAKATFLSLLEPGKKYTWNELQHLAQVDPTQLKRWLKGTEWEL